MLPTFLLQVALAATCVLASPYPLPKSIKVKPKVGKGFSGGDGGGDGSTLGSVMDIWDEHKQNHKHDRQNLQAFPDNSVPDNNWGQLYERFQPLLTVASSDHICSPYAAVDKDGHTNYGMEGEEPCMRFENGGQVYARYFNVPEPRMKKFNDPYGTAIMFAWYFPRRLDKRHDWQQVIIWLDGPSVDSKIQRVAFSQPNGYKVVDVSRVTFGQDKDSVAVRYIAMDGGTGLLSGAASDGVQHDLVAWESLPHNAWKALNKEGSFDNKVCPLADSEFKKHLYAGFA